MAIEFVGGIAGFASSNNSLTLDLTNLTGGSASSPSEDDIVLVHVSANASAHQAPSTSGYTSVAQVNNSSYRSSLHRKTMGATPDSSVQIGGNTTFFSGTHGIALVYRNVDTTTPMDATATTANGGSGGDPNPAAITTQTDGARVAVFGFVNGNLTSYDAPPSGYTQRQGEESGNETAATADKTVATAGAENPGAFDTNGGTNWTAITVALRPGETADELTSQDVTSGQPTIDQATITLTYDLVSSDSVSSAPDIDQATLGTIHVLSVGDTISSAPTIDALTIGQEHALTVQDISASSPIIDQAILGLADDVIAQDLIAGTPNINGLNMGQIHDLVIGDIFAGVPTIDEQDLLSNATDEFRFKENTYFATNNHLPLKKKEVNNRYILALGVARLEELGKTVSDGE